MGGDTIALLVGALGTLFTAITGAIVLWLNAVHKNELERQERKARKEADALAEYKGLVDRQDAQINRQQLQLDQQQAVIGGLHDENRDLRVSLAELWADFSHQHDSLCRGLAALRRLGEDPGPDPVLREKPRPGNPELSDFQRRTTEQNTILVQRINPSQRPPESTDHLPASGGNNQQG